jgi:hypothetical protein
MPPERTSGQGKREKKSLSRRKMVFGPSIVSLDGGSRLSTYTGN